MKKYLDSKYQEYLSDKRVAIVGPASYLLGLNIGKTIDSYDIIVRVNRGLDVITLYSDDIGTKTNILYNCGVKNFDNGGDLDLEFYKSKGVEWISTIPGSDYYGNCYDNSLNKSVDMDFIKSAKKEFRFHLMDWHNYSSLNKTVKCRANTGFSAIFDLLVHQVSELFICGYSFYLDAFIKGYKKECKRHEEKFAKECFNSKRHIQPNQWLHLKEVFCRDERVTVDPVLDKILNMNKLCREEFKEFIYTD
jgi:hypothetical protein